MAGRGLAVWRRCRKCKQLANDSRDERVTRCPLHREGPLLPGEVISLSSTSPDVNDDVPEAFYATNHSLDPLGQVTFYSDAHLVRPSGIPFMSMSKKPIPPQVMRCSGIPEIISLSSSSPA